MALAPSSPRLPSPPPPTEIQIGTQSPSQFSSQESTVEQSVIDSNSRRRIHPGTKSADMAAGPPLVPLGELDSAFQLQEHLKALHYHYTKPSGEDHTIPLTRETALIIATQPDGLDRALWLYELCRFLINKCNDLIVGFLFDTPPCSASTCPEMRASEWQFLCAVHESPKSCCAIDYCCHTLDWATNIVTSQKIFPSRLSLGAGDATDDRGAGVKHLINIFRRLHRIFAHAWFQHREVFWRVEGQTGLYVFFKTVCDNYDLLPAEAYKLPPEAEGLEPVEEVKAPAPKILQNREDKELFKSSVEEQFMGVGSIGRTNTRRHIRQSPSVGSAVTTVHEAEEEDPDVTRKLRNLSIAESEEEGGSEIPVIVETYEVPEHEVAQEETTAAALESSNDRFSHAVEHDKWPTSHDLLAEAQDEQEKPDFITEENTTSNAHTAPKASIIEEAHEEKDTTKGADETLTSSESDPKSDTIDHQDLHAQHPNSKLDALDEGESVAQAGDESDANYEKKETTS